MTITEAIARPSWMSDEDWRWYNQSRAYPLHGVSPLSGATSLERLYDYHPRHLRAYPVSLQALAMQLIAGQVTHHQCIDGLPEDAVLCWSFIEEVLRIVFVFEHPSFREVPAGGAIERAGVTFRALALG